MWVGVLDCCGAAAAIRPREVAIGRGLILDRGRTNLFQVFLPSFSSRWSGYFSWGEMKRSIFLYSKDGEDRHGFSDSPFAKMADVEVDTFLGAK